MTLRLMLTYMVGGRVELAIVGWTSGQAREPSLYLPAKRKLTDIIHSADSNGGRIGESIFGYTSPSHVLIVLQVTTCCLERVTTAECLQLSSEQPQKSPIQHPTPHP